MSSVLCDPCNDCTCEIAACGKCMCLHLSVDCQWIQISGKWKSISELKNHHCSVQDEDRQEFQLLLDFQSSCCSHWFDKEEKCWMPQVSLWLRRISPPSCLGIDLKIMSINSFKLLAPSLSWSLYRMNGCISFCSLKSLSHVHHAVFLILVLLRRNLDVDWTPSFYVQREYPISLVSSSFLSCCNIGMVFQCKPVILNNLLLSPPNNWQRPCGINSLVPSFQKGFALTMLGLASFLQASLGFV